ncbi:MAG: glycosyltransferase, partial [bacterium]|nr:glycosyltransferase [bacterium]
MNDIVFYLQQYVDIHPFILPLGLIGIWRWASWTLKEIVALNYKPKTNSYKANVSIVTPVYNENPVIFSLALESWKKNNPQEIIAVIDYTDKPCIEIFKCFAASNKKAHLIVTKIPGKRPALADGIKKAKSEIVALVDSDTLWADDVIKNGLPPFIDPKMAGVATYQNVLDPKTMAQKIFDTQLDLRYCDDYPFLAVAGDALVCLSGRTAFYRRKVILPMLPDLVNETFLGKPVISGDDKRLTYLVLAAGWKTAYQNNSQVYTPGMADLGSYLNQRLRWTRNALRADLRAIKEGWTWKHPGLAFFQVDKLFQALAVIFSPIYFFISIVTGLWPIAIIIAIWWCVSRSIKLAPHLKRRPQDVTLLPAFILYSFLTGVVKIYAFFTLNTQGWITRWDSARLSNLKFIGRLPGYLATALAIIILTAGVYLYKDYSYFKPRRVQAQLIASTLPYAKVSSEKEASSPQSANGFEKKLLSSRYIVQPGDSMASIAQKFDINVDNLLASNISWLTNWNRIEAGTILTIPGKDVTFTSTGNFNYQRIYPDVRRIEYEESTNTIHVYGRGISITLADMQVSVPDKLKEVAPKEWYLTANIFLHSGVTLTLDNNEVNWLKLESNKNKFTNLYAYNSSLQFHNVKITSWDETTHDYDKNMKDGRSYILVKDGSRMDIYNSELAYLGYPRTPELTVSPYGVSWRMSNGKRGTVLLTGEIIESKFHDNYFGAYTFGATGMLWKKNEFYSNVRYGLDPHDDSNGFLVEENIAHDNGAHGIIFSKRCMYNTIRNNLSYNNKLHGIMLHEKSDENLIEGNTLYGDTDGVALWHSSNNTVRNNTIRDNKNGVRANAGSIH